MNPRIPFLTPAVAWSRRRLGMDRAVALTVFGRVWQGTAGLVTVGLIARFLSAAEQGYYYTFGSLLTLQIIFELGFSFVVLQLAAHERIHLAIGDDGSISGDVAAHDRLASIFRATAKWYGVMAVAFWAVLMPVGFYFFQTFKNNQHAVHWQLPWLSSISAAALAFFITPAISLYEGLGYVPEACAIRLTQAVVSSLFAWSALCLHAGLMAPAMNILGGVLTAAFMLFRRRRIFVDLLRRNPGANRIRWREDVFSFQWRIAISWICTYFIYQAFTPIIFMLRGPIEAGRMGMTMTFAGAVQIIAIAWVNTKAAPMGSLIAQHDYAGLDRMFFGSLRQAMRVGAAGATTVFLGVMGLRYAGLAFAQRLLDPLSLALILISSTANIIVNSEALYLRAHKQEKLFINSIANAVCTLSMTFLLGRLWGAAGVAGGYLFSSLIIGLGWCTYIFQKYRKLWHAQPRCENYAG